jgi:hypothetical protein
MARKRGLMMRPDVVMIAWADGHEPQLAEMLLERWGVRTRNAADVAAM